MARYVDAWEGAPFGVSEGSAGQVEASVDDIQGDRVTRSRELALVTSKDKGSVFKNLYAVIHHLQA